MPCSRINTAVCASCRMLPRNWGNSATTSLSKATCRAVGNSTPALGESKIDSRNCHPCASAHGRRRICGVNEDVRIDNKHLTPSFHHIVQCVAIGDIDQIASASKSREGAKFRFRFAAAGLKQQTQRCFDQLGHSFTLAGRFPTETIHDGIVDVERCLHMGNHIGYMAICQTPNLGRLHAFIRDTAVQQSSNHIRNLTERGNVVFASRAR